MSSQINILNIDVAYPIAGIDNDSQGFRDNFNAIRSGLATAKEELTQLQTDTAKVNAPNNFNGNTIDNAVISRLYNVIDETGIVNSSTSLNVDNGTLQYVILGANVPLTFTHWPAAGQYGVVRIHLRSNIVADRTPTFLTENSGIIRKESSFPNPLTVSNATDHKVIEAWSFDGGANVYLRYLGEF